MNEAEWLSGDDPAPMLKFAQSGDRRRSVRLFGCACCRRAWALLPPESRAAVEAAERFADGRATTAELEAARARAADAVLALPTVWVFEVERLRYATAAAADCAAARSAAAPGGIAIASKTAHALSLDAALTGSTEEFTLTRAAAFTAERRAQADLVRELFGNPYRRAPLAPDWRTDTAIQIARHIYDSRDFTAMPILADALQDAGCDCGDVLDHCRASGAAHARGCWVIDLVLGNSKAEGAAGLALSAQ